MEQKPRGFATWDKAKQRQAARKGGRVAHQKGVAHQWTQTEAQAAGLKAAAGRAIRKASA